MQGRCRVAESARGSPARDSTIILSITGLISGTWMEIKFVFVTTVGFRCLTTKHKD